MSKEFYVTKKGFELIDQAIKNETNIDINKIKAGDGGTGVIDTDLTSLRNQTYEKTFDPLTDAYEIIETDPKQILVKFVIPKGVTGKFNEVGFFDRNDNLIVYGNVLERDKPETINFMYQCILEFKNTDEDTVNIVVKSPEFEKVEALVAKVEKEFNIEGYATKEYVDEKFGGIDLKDLLPKSEAESDYLKKTDAQNDYGSKTELDEIKQSQQSILETLNQWV